jgi:hypothetical protein
MVGSIVTLLADESWRTVTYTACVAQGHAVEASLGAAAAQAENYATALPSVSFYGHVPAACRGRRHGVRPKCHRFMHICLCEYVHIYMHLFSFCICECGRGCPCVYMQGPLFCAHECISCIATEVRKVCDNLLVMSAYVVCICMYVIYIYIYIYILIYTKYIYIYIYICISYCVFKLSKPRACDLALTSCVHMWIFSASTRTQKQTPTQCLHAYSTRQQFHHLSRSKARELKELSHGYVSGVVHVYPMHKSGWRTTHSRTFRLFACFHSRVF